MGSTCASPRPVGEVWATRRLKEQKPSYVSLSLTDVSPQTASQRQRHRAVPVHHALVDRIQASLGTESLAYAVYGSQARGTATDRSDIDVLQLVDSRPGVHSAGPVNVTSYLPFTLREMAMRGSLFVLHLKTDGIILHDPLSVLRDVIACYVAPSSYEPLLVELRAAAQALEFQPGQEQYQDKLLRMGVYILRTAIYAHFAGLGAPVFDVPTAAAIINDMDICQALNLRYKQTADHGDLQILHRALKVMLRSELHNEWGSPEALAVALSHTRPYAASLLTQVLLDGDVGLDYTVLAPPPL